MKKIIFLSLILSAIFSCSKKENQKTNAETAYLEAVNLLKKKDYAEAATEFEKIDDEYPFSRWATKAQTMAVYARYKREEYAKVVANVEDFIRLNPSSEYVPYMLYMKGLTYYNQIPAIDRAQDNTQQSSFVFRELIARFPDSAYAEDAKSKLSFIDEHLSGAKMSIGRYQIKSRNYVGAVISFNEVISRYRYTRQVPEAYFRLVEIYTKIGLREEAKKLFAELKRKFPDNEWSAIKSKNASKDVIKQSPHTASREAKILVKPSEAGDGLSYPESAKSKQDIKVESAPVLSAPKVRYVLTKDK